MEKKYLKHMEITDRNELGLSVRWVQKWTVSVHGFDGYDGSVKPARRVGCMTYNFIGWIGKWTHV